MNVAELLRYVPDILLLLIPGYIVLKIREDYGWEKKLGNMETVLLSIMYSFVVGIIFALILSAARHLFPAAAIWISREVVRRAFFLIIAALLGGVFVRARKTKAGRMLMKWINPSVAPYSSVWQMAVDNPDGAWANVYLNNGMIYTGVLAGYATSPDDDRRDILLRNFRLSMRRGSFDSEDPDLFCTVVEDHTEDDNAKVFLDGESIVSVEILP